MALGAGGTNEVAGDCAAVASGRLRFGVVDTDGIPSPLGWEGLLTVLHDLRTFGPKKDFRPVQTIETIHKWYTVFARQP